MAEIKHIFHINAPIEKVFEAITDVAGLQQWWTQDTKGSGEVGERLHFQFGNGGFIKFEVLEKKSPEFVRWKCFDAHPEWIGTEATFNLSSSEEGKVRVSFVHSGWEEASDFFASCNFSWARYFISLRSYCEGGTGDPYT